MSVWDETDISIVVIGALREQDNTPIQSQCARQLQSL